MNTKILANLRRISVGCLIVQHNLLAVKFGLSSLALVSILSVFFKGSRQRVLWNWFVGEWRLLNEENTKDSVSGPQLFTIFLNGLLTTLRFTWLAHLCYLHTRTIQAFYTLCEVEKIPRKALSNSFWSGLAILGCPAALANSRGLFFERRDALKHLHWCLVFLRIPLSLFWV